MNFSLYSYLFSADIILGWSKIENALAHHACVLRSDLEKAVKDNALLFLKIGMLFNLVSVNRNMLCLSINRNVNLGMMFYLIGREDKLNADNRVVVNNFQEELAQQIGFICNLVSSSVSQQNEHLESVEKLCRSFTDTHQKVLNGSGIQDSPFLSQLMFYIFLSVGVLVLFWSSFVSNADLAYINIAFRQSWI